MEPFDVYFGCFFSLDYETYHQHRGEAMMTEFHVLAELLFVVEFLSIWGQLVHNLLP